MTGPAAKRVQKNPSLTFRGIEQAGVQVDQVGRVAEALLLPSTDVIESLIYSPDTGQQTLTSSFPCNTTGSLKTELVGGDQGMLRGQADYIRPDLEQPSGQVW
jgi:hypothetical protein